MTHKGTQTLKTERLILRRFAVDDAADMFYNWANDERVTRFLTWEPHGSIELTKEILKTWCAAYQEKNCYNWVIELEGRAIGGISVVLLNEKHESAELGYCMGYDNWGKGIMTEAVKAVRDYLFGEIGVHRIVIHHALKNPASGRVAQKCGFTLEGIEKEVFKSKTGEFWDMAQYAMIRKAWDGVKLVE